MQEVTAELVEDAVKRFYRVNSKNTRNADKDVTIYLLFIFMASDVQQMAVRFRMREMNIIKRINLTYERIQTDEEFRDQVRQIVTIIEKKINWSGEK